MQDPAHRPNQNHSFREQNYKSLSFFNVFHPNKYIFSLFLVWLCLLARAGAVQAQQKLDLSIASVRSAYAEQLAEQDQMAKEHAWAVARKQGWSPKKQVGNVLYELMAIRDGRVYMNITNNKNAAISTATDLVRNTAPYNLNGSGLTVGIWDGGAVLSTHYEFGGRVNVMDGATDNYHSTHVGGTIGAAGVVANALGMAPSVASDSYEWRSDASDSMAGGCSGCHQNIVMKNLLFTTWENSSRPKIGQFDLQRGRK